MYLTYHGLPGYTARVSRLAYPFCLEYPEDKISDVRPGPKDVLKGYTAMVHCKGTLQGYTARFPSKTSLGYPT